MNVLGHNYWEVGLSLEFVGMLGVLLVWIPVREARHGVARKQIHLDRIVAVSIGLIALGVGLILVGMWLDS